MALIRCRECEKQYSDKAEACPQCGCPTKYNLEVDSFEYAHEHPGHSHGRRFREEPEEEWFETSAEEPDENEPSEDIPKPKKTEPEITKEEFEKIYVPRPHRPLFIASGLVLAAGIAGIVIAIWDMVSPGSILSFRGESSIQANVFLILACLFLMAVTVVFFMLRWRRYRAAQQNFEGYKKKLQKLIYEKRKKREV